MAKKTTSTGVTLQAPHKSAGTVGAKGNEHTLDKLGRVTLDTVKDSELVSELIHFHKFTEVFEEEE